MRVIPRLWKRFSLKINQTNNKTYKSKQDHMKLLIKLKISNQLLIVSFMKQIWLTVPIKIKQIQKKSFSRNRLIGRDNITVGKTGKHGVYPYIYLYAETGNLMTRFSNSFFYLITLSSLYSPISFITEPQFLFKNSINHYSIIILRGVTCPE